MFSRDFIFTVTLDAVWKNEQTIYIPKVLFGGNTVWKSDETFTDRKVALEVGELRLVKMMQPILNPEQYQQVRFAAALT